MRIWRLAGVGLAFCLTACSDTDPVCALVLAPAITVHVRDSISLANAVAGAKLVARSGAYADSTTGPSDGTSGDVLLGGFRAGVYTLTISKAGYQNWVKSNVTVTGKACGLDNVELTALLQQ